MFASVKSAFTAASEKREASYSHSNAISVFWMMYRPSSYIVDKVILQRYHDVTTKTCSDCLKGELANQLQENYALICEMFEFQHFFH